MENNHKNAEKFFNEFQNTPQQHTSWDIMVAYANEVNVKPNEMTEDQIENYVRKEFPYFNGGVAEYNVFIYNETIKYQDFQKFLLNSQEPKQERGEENRQTIIINPKLSYTTIPNEQKCEGCGRTPTVIYSTPTGRFCEACKPN